MSRASKDALFETIVQVVQAAANPHRLELLDLLIQAPRTVEQLADASALSVANASQHLQRLKRAGLVTTERRGTSIRYAIASPSVARLWIELRAVATQHLAAMDRALDGYRPQRHQFATIEPDEVRAGLARGDVVLLDVRPRVEFDAGHLPGAQPRKRALGPRVRGRAMATGGGHRACSIEGPGTKSLARRPPAPRSGSTGRQSQRACRAQQRPPAPSSGSTRRSPRTRLQKPIYNLRIRGRGRAPQQPGPHPAQTPGRARREQ